MPTPHSRTARRVGSVALATGLALSLAGTVPASAEPEGGAPDSGEGALTPFHDQELVWSECEVFLPDQECAEIEVPLDYAAPDDDRITVGISRSSANDQEERLGVLLTNPGGPGMPARLTAGQVGDASVGEVYDVIGMDPRGLGASTRLDCEQEYPGVPARPTDEEIDQAIDNMREYSESCDAADSDLRPHITTANTARDMDVVRAVLGEQQINYLGYSYGSYLGAVYGSLFPDNLDRSVLDSAVDPDSIWRETFLVQGPASTANVERYTAWLVEHNDVFGLGTDHEEIMAVFDETEERLREEPREEEGGPTYDDTYFRHVVVSSARQQGSWEESGLLLKALAEESALPDTPGAPEEPEQPEQPQPPEIPEEELERLSGGWDMASAIMCEGDWPTDTGVYQSDMRSYREAHRYGPGVNAALPQTCAFTEHQPTEPRVELTRDGDTPALVIAGEFDASTPHEGGVTMASRLDSPLLTITDEGGHGFYASPDRTDPEGESYLYPCVDAAVEAYLIDGEDPVEQECAGIPRPDMDR
jgi:pimeloyl-ACP methyl ester carboxylesterase